MKLVTSREVIHHFSAIAARVAAGEELTVTRHGKPLIKLVQINPAELDPQARAALVRKALALRMSEPYGKHFERSDAHQD